MDEKSCRSASAEMVEMEDKFAPQRQLLPGAGRPSSLGFTPSLVDDTECHAEGARDIKGTYCSSSFLE